jgi:predicted DNA-binding helix-hairpin-helix protein
MGETFINEVDIQPVVFQAPEQAFFNIDNRCIYGCTFCSAPLLREDQGKKHSLDGIVLQILDAHRKDALDEVAITSGVPDTPKETVQRMAYVIQRIKRALPNVNIGVEPYISSMDQINDLRKAGADEIRIEH